jgi:hypothetical protein
MQMTLSKYNKDEILQLFYIGLILFLVSTENGFGLIVFQSLFLDEIGSQYLPYAFILDVFFSLLGIFSYIKFLTHFSKNSLFIGTNILLSLLLLTSYVLISTHSKGNGSIGLISSFVIQIAIHAITITILGSIAWDFINRMFRPVLLKKYIHIFILVSILSELFSAILAKVSGVLLPSHSLLIVWASIYMLCASIYYGKYGAGVYDRSKKSESLNGQVNLFEGLKYLKVSRISFILLTISFLYYLSQEFIYFQLAVAAEERYVNGSEIAQFYGILQFCIYATVMVFLIIFQNRLLGYIGLFGSMAIVPTVITIGALVLLWSFGFWQITLFWGIVLFLICVVYEPAIQCTFGMIDPKWRGIVIALSELFKLAGAALAGIILLIGNNQVMWWISLCAFVFAAFQLVVTFFGSRVYLKTLIENLSDNKMQFVSLESIEDAHDTLINKKLLGILLDSSGRVSTDTKIKVLETIKRLGNALFLRALAMLVKNPEPVIRSESIAAANHLLKKTSKNFLIERYFIRKMKEFIAHDHSLTVKAHAIEFLFDHSSREDILLLFKQFFTDKDAQFKISSIRALRHSSLNFKDFLEIDIINDPDPDVRAEAIIDLWKYEEYQQISRSEVENLLRADNQREKHAALRVLALTLITVNKGSEDEILRISEQPASDESKLYALLYRLRGLKKDDPERARCLEKVLKIAVDCFDSSPDKWRNFLEELLCIEDTVFLYEFLDSIIDFAVIHPEISLGTKQIANIMNAGMEAVPIVGRIRL